MIIYFINSMNNIIAILNKDLTVGVFLICQNGDIAYEFFGNFEKEKLADFDNFIKTNNPRSRREINEEGGNKITMMLEEINKEDSRYENALLEELRGRGFLSAIIPSSLQETLLCLSGKNISYAQRKEIIGDIVNLSGEEAQKITEAVKEISLLQKEIAENRSRWKEFLEKKRSELRKKLQK